MLIISYDLIGGIRNIIRMCCRCLLLFPGRSFRPSERRLKRRFTALIFTLFHLNPSVRITTAVSGRFLLRNDHRFTPFLYTFLDWRITTAVSGRFSLVYSRFRPFMRRSVGPGLRCWCLLIGCRRISHLSIACFVVWAELL